MKKLFIGCGCLVLLALGGLGFIVSRIAPSAMELQERTTAFQASLVELDDRHPFDPEAVVELDAERFADSLDLRRALMVDVDAWVEEMSSYDERLEDEDLGFFDTIGAAFAVMNQALDSFGPFFDTVVARLTEADMGPTEFGFHSRVLWAALKDVDAGVGDPALASLSGKYSYLKGAWTQMARNHESDVGIDEIIGQVDPALLLVARQVMATDTARVEAGIGKPELEFQFLQMPSEAVPFGRLESRAGDGSVSISIDTSGLDPRPDGEDP